MAEIERRQRLTEERQAEGQNLERVERLALSQDRCSTLMGFIGEAWHILEPRTPFIGGWHLDAMGEHLEAVTRRQIQHLSMQVPRGAMKSLMLDFWNAWEWGPRGMSYQRYMSGSYERGLAIRDNRKVRRLISSDWFQERWPLRLTKDGDELFENIDGGERRARAFLSMTGGRANRVMIDDPHSVDTAESDVERAKVILTMRESVIDCLGDQRRDSIVLAMQRLHTHDCAWLVKEMALGFEVLEIPMEFDTQRARNTSRIGWRDPRTFDGELMCPEKWPAETIAKLKSSKTAYSFSSQYQQAPVPREGGMFKLKWFEGKILERHELPPMTLSWRHWDLAATKRDATDTVGARTAGVLMGRARDGRFIVLDCKVAAEEAENVRRLIKRTALADIEAWTPAPGISLPQDPGQAGKAQRAEFSADLAAFNVRITPETGDKVTRAEPFAAQCENGNVYLLAGSYVEGFLAELTSFPGGARKDIPDACSGAYARLIPSMRDMIDDGFAAPEVFQREKARPGYDDDFAPIRSGLS